MNLRVNDGPPKARTEPQILFGVSQSFFIFSTYFVARKQKYFYNPGKFENWLTESIGCLVIVKRTSHACSSWHKILVYRGILEC